jgi:hypothetical protein
MSGEKRDGRGDERRDRRNGDMIGTRSNICTEEEVVEDE